MSIFYDATESRVGTRLPDSVLTSGQAVTGLEAATGADILLSTLSVPTLPARLDPDSRPHQVALRKHLDSGALIQRKFGADFTNSIPNLPNIIRRMRETGCGQCWLYIDADLKRNRHNKCVVNGRDTDWDWHAIRGAKVAWELRGGYLYQSPYPEEMGQWVGTILNWLRETQSEPSKQVYSRPPRQILTGPDWKSILCSLPGIGPTNAEDIADVCETLAFSLELLSDVTYAGRVPGIGKGKIGGVRRAMGLKAGQVMRVTGPDNIEETE
jgi:hypothetical protein